MATPLRFAKLATLFHFVTAFSNKLIFPSHSVSEIQSSCILHQSSKSTGSTAPNPLQEALFRSEIDSARKGTWLDSVSSLPFECTSCGKCCRTIGTVYMDPDEISAAAKYMNQTTADFIKSCASSETMGMDDSELPWITVKNKETEKGPACHFLDAETNQCTIYPVRPIQCSTYPFWNDVMTSEYRWNNEARRADDDVDSSLAPWTAEGGGCEGLKTLDYDGSRPDEVGVPIEEAMEQLILYERNDRRLPRQV
jgi:Fe-S-cluster containining protein